MQRIIYVSCKIEMQLTARSSILVQGAQSDKGAATFYQAYDPATDKEQFCIPASTLKGVWRSTVERILRSFDPQLACDPFCQDSEKPSCFCGKRAEGKVTSQQAYGITCPACRLFGSTIHAGLIRINDAWAEGTPRPITMTGIAIDRFTGGVKQGALYSLEALPIETSFHTCLSIDNVEFWQLGLLALAGREMSEGHIRVGSGTRRGLGHLAVTWQKIQFIYPKSLYEKAATQQLSSQSGVLAPAQALALGHDHLNYPEAEAWLLPELKPEPPHDWRDAQWLRFHITDNTVERLQAACVNQALANKLRKQGAGFAYALQKEAANHAELPESL